MQLSVIICTYNRAELLKKCLASIENQIKEIIEVIVVDNHSTDQTKEVAESFKNTIPTLIYVYESTIGLSNARNKGVQESNAPWILFLDDDAICEKNTIGIAIELIQKKADFGIIGGVYEPYFNVSKPKWMPTNFGSNIPEYKVFRKIAHVDEQLPSGGILLIKKSVFADNGTFDPNLGMKGNKIGYGEETSLIIKALSSNIKVGISPDFRIKHLVGLNKYNITWHIRSYYVSRKAYFNIRRPSLYAVIQYFIRGNMATLFKRLPKLISDKDYYWQNLVIEATYPFSYMLAYFFNE